MAKDSITVKRAYSDGLVSISVRLSGSGYRSDSINVMGSTDISIPVARSLAADLIRLADEADVKAEKKRAADERRKKWREREIAAGRMQVVSFW